MIISTINDAVKGVEKKHADVVTIAHSVYIELNMLYFTITLPQNDHCALFKSSCFLLIIGHCNMMTLHVYFYYLVS